MMHFALFSQTLFIFTLLHSCPHSVSEYMFGTGLDAGECSNIEFLD